MSESRDGRMSKQTKQLAVVPLGGPASLLPERVLLFDVLDMSLTRTFADDYRGE